MATFALGMNAKIYYGDAGATATTELSNVRDVTLNLEAGEADVTTRANSGWRATAATLKECTCEFEMLWKSGDAGFNAMKNAYLTNAEIALAVYTADVADAEAEGIDADFTITKFSRSEPLEEGITVSVTAKLSTFRAWKDSV